MIPRGLVIAISVGITAGAIFGIFFMKFDAGNELSFVEGNSLSIIMEKTDFNKGETVEIKIINSGTTPISFSDTSYGLEIRGLDGTVLYSPISAQVISTLEPNEQVIFKWNQIKNDGTLALEGTYKISSRGFTLGEKTVKDSITIHIFK